VIVEADGQWHTADNKFGSASWKAAHPPVKDPTLSLPPTPVKKRSPTPVKSLANGDTPGRSGPSNAEIVILDSDDEEEGQVKRELSPSAYRSLNNSSVSIGSLPPRSQTADSEVIDLTLDSDNEDPVVSLSNPKKRKSDERDIASPTEQIWKKSRVDISPTASAAAALSPTPVPCANSSSSSYSPPVHDPTRVLPPLSPNRYTNGNGYVPHPAVPPTYGTTYIPPGGAPVPARPPPYSGSPPYLAQPNGSSPAASWRS
jgi:E3 SUMO-protein ligase PIAS1